MKLIGITGKAGSGKTTISNMLQEYPGVAVIHVDELVDKEKENKFSLIMDSDKNGRPIVVKKRMREFIYNNKILFRVFMKLKNALIQSKINKKIMEYEKQGFTAVVIDSIYLKYLSIYKQLDVKILMRRSYSQRLQSVLERDKDKNMDKARFISSDIPYKRGYCKEHINSYKYIIRNTTIDNLRRQAQKIFEKEIQKRNFIEECKVSKETSKQNNREHSFTEKQRKVKQQEGRAE